MNEVILITGGALRLGAETANTLHAAGMRVVVHYQHSADAALALVQALNDKRADSACSLHADLREPAAITQLVADAAQRWNRLDGLVNNASVFRPTPVADASLEDWASIFDVNLRAPFLLAQAAYPWLSRQQGAIVNLTDIYADRPKAGHALYCTSKAGLLGLTRVLAREFAPTVRVNAVAPGAILWPESGEVSEQARLLARTPLGRAGAPTDIADAVLYLLQAPYVTGQEIAVDGGRSIND